MECRGSDCEMIEYLIEKLERLNSGAVVSCRYDITEELKKLGVDPNLKISEATEQLKKLNY